MGDTIYITRVNCQRDERIMHKGRTTSSSDIRWWKMGEDGNEKIIQVGHPHVPKGQSYLIYELHLPFQLAIGTPKHRVADMRWRVLFQYKFIPNFISTVSLILYPSIIAEIPRGRYLGGNCNSITVIKKYWHTSRSITR